MQHLRSLILFSDYKGFFYFRICHIFNYCPIVLFKYILHVNHDINISKYTSNTSQLTSKMYGLKTPQIFHCYWDICCTFSECLRKNIRSLYLEYRGGFLKNYCTSLAWQNRRWSPQIWRQIFIWKIFFSS